MAYHDRTEALLKDWAHGKELPLGTSKVGVLVTHECAKQAQGQHLAVFLANLAGRLFPVIYQLDFILIEDLPLRICVPRWGEQTLGGTLRAILDQCANVPCCQVTSEVGADYDCLIAIGEYSSSEIDFWGGSSGWNVYLSSNNPVPLDGKANPVGAYGAACFLIAQIWNKILSSLSDLLPYVPIRPLDGDIIFSTFDFSHHESAPNPELIDRIDLGSFTLVGCGAGGSALGYTLASFPKIVGKAVVIEPDTVGDTNLNRLVTATLRDVHRGKISVLEESISCSGIHLEGYAVPFDEAKRRLEPQDLEFVVSAVHTRAARRSVQMKVPKWLWDGGATGQGDFFVWRTILGQSECMVCRIESVMDPEKEKSQQLSQLLGLPEVEVYQKIRDNGGFSTVDVKCISDQFDGKDISFDLPQVGQALSDWEADQCGKLKLPELDAEIPVPFTPVLVGVLLAGELIKTKLYGDTPLDSKYWNTLMGCFLTRNKVSRVVPLAGCPVCSEPVFLRLYEKLSRIKNGIR